MTNKQWLEMISEKREEIMEAGEKAFKDAVEERHLQYHIEMDSEGVLNVWYQAAGNNNMTMSSYKGESITLMTLCEQHLEITTEWEAYKEVLEEKGIDLSKEIEEEEFEDMAEYELVQYVDEHYNEVTKEVDRAWLEMYKDSWYYTVDSKLDKTIENLEMEDEE